jgi:hypothetical protein
MGGRGVITVGMSMGDIRVGCGTYFGLKITCWMRVTLLDTIEKLIE